MKLRNKKRPGDLSLLADPREFLYLHKYVLHSRMDFIAKTYSFFSFILTYIRIHRIQDIQAHHRLMVKKPLPAFRLHIADHIRNHRHITVIGQTQRSTEAPRLNLRMPLYRGYKIPSGYTWTKVTFINMPDQSFMHLPECPGLCRQRNPSSKRMSHRSTGMQKLDSSVGIHSLRRFIQQAITQQSSI